MPRIEYYNTIQELKNNQLTPTVQDPVLTFIVGGYWAPGDGGGGTFRFQNGPKPSTDPAWISGDDGLIINSDPNFGLPNVWYQRLVNTPYISVKWFGAKGDNDNNDITAINKAFQAAQNFQNLWNVNSRSGNSEMELQFFGAFDATRTRIYFPAGIYRIGHGIGVPYSTTSGIGFTRHDITGLEIIGENAIITPIKKSLNKQFLGVYGAYFNVGLGTKISGLTFTGFAGGLDITNPGTDAVDILIENCNFSDIGGTGIRINCYNDSVIAINNTTWRNCRYAFTNNSDNLSVTGGWIKPSPIVNGNDYHIFHYKGNLSLKDMVFQTPVNSPHPATQDPAYSYSWIVNQGDTVRIENVQFLGAYPEEWGQSIHRIIKNQKKGTIWQTTNAIPVTIIIRECHCWTHGPTIELEKLPNSIVFENNFGFASYEPPLIYTGSGTLQQRLDEMIGLFSITMDNLPYPGQAHSQGTSIYHKGTSKEQLKFLPYIRVNNGLHSYGFVEDLSTNPQPQLLRFFMGKRSFSTNPNHNATFGAHSYEIFLANVTAYIPGQGANMGNTFKYSIYRIETKVVGTQSTPNLVLLTQLTNGCPMIEIINGVYHIKSFSATGIPHNSGKKQRPFSVFYEIRSLTPPPVQVTNV